MFRCIYIFVKVIFDLRSQFVCLTTFIVHSVLFYDFIFRAINDKSYWYGTRYDKVEKELYQFPLNSFHTRVIFKNICWLSFGIIILLSFLLGSNKKKSMAYLTKVTSWLMLVKTRTFYFLLLFIRNVSMADIVRLNQISACNTTYHFDFEEISRIRTQV